MENKPTKISCGTHFFLRYYWDELKIALEMVYKGLINTYVLNVHG